MEYKITSLAPSDIKGIAEIEKECFSEPWSEGAIKEAFDYGTAFFVAKTDGAVIGYVGVKKIRDEADIANVAVTKKARKCGVGDSLIKAVSDWAKQEGVKKVSLEVRVTNSAAISLYKKHNYTEVGRRKNFYRNPSEDALILSYEV